MSNAAPNSYLRNAVLTATPEQLHLMLYDGAIRFSLQARDAIEAKDHEALYNKLSRAQAIIVEMQNGLRPEVNADLCERMAGIYAFLYRKLVDACVNRSMTDIDDALKILRYQRETWALLMDKVAKARAGTDGPPAQAPAAHEPPPGAPAGSTLSIEG